MMASSASSDADCHAPPEKELEAGMSGSEAPKGEGIVSRATICSGPLKKQVSQESMKVNAAGSLLRMAIVEDGACEEHEEGMIKKENESPRKRIARTRARTDGAGAATASGNSRLHGGSIVRGSPRTPQQSPRPQSSKCSFFGVNTTVTRDPTSRTGFWKHHTELLNRLAAQYPGDYTMEGMPIGIVPSLSVMGLKVPVTMQALDFLEQSGNLSFESQMRTSRTSRASSRCSSHGASDSQQLTERHSKEDTDLDSDDEENPPFDLPQWLAPNSARDDESGEDGGSSSEGFSDVSR
jgi:hypothetical protein